MTNNSSHLVLARRLRPQKLSDVIGQPSVSQYLANAIQSQKIPHAILLTGPRGTGKTSCARIIAKSLCCEKGPTIEPCQVCIHCLNITSSSHQDVLEIDGASNTGIDHIRELKEISKLYPSIARYKIFIIDEVHMLSIGAFNALLKTLEEPPENVIFILATTELQKVPVTVRSRCVSLFLKRIPQGELVAYLENLVTKEGFQYEKEAIELITQRGEGSFRDSLSILEQVFSSLTDKNISLSVVRNLLSVHGDSFIEKIFEYICSKDLASVLKQLDDCEQTSVAPNYLIERLLFFFKETLFLKKGFSSASLSKPDADFLNRHHAQLNEAAITEILKSLLTVHLELARTTVPYDFIMMTLTEVVLKAEWISPQELLSTLLSKKSLSIPLVSQQNSSTPLVNKPKETVSIPKTAPPLIAKPVIPLATKNISISPQPEIAPFLPNAPLFQKSAISEHGLRPINTEALKNFISFIEKKNKILSAKFRRIEFKCFNTEVVEFANPQETELLSLKAEDKALVEESLVVSFGKQPKLIGFTLKTQSISYRTVHSNEKKKDFEDRKKKLEDLGYLEILKEFATEIEVLDDSTNEGP